MSCCCWLDNSMRTLDKYSSKYSSVWESILLLSSPQIKLQACSLNVSVKLVSKRWNQSIRYFVIMKPKSSTISWLKYPSPLTRRTSVGNHTGEWFIKNCHRNLYASRRSPYTITSHARQISGVHYKYSHTYMARDIFKLLSSLCWYKCNYQIFWNELSLLLSTKQHHLPSLCNQEWIHRWNLLHWRRSASCTERTWKLIWVVHVVSQYVYPEILS